MDEELRRLTEEAAANAEFDALLDAAIPDVPDAPEMPPHVLARLDQTAAERSDRRSH